YSCIQDWTEGGTGNISLNPRLSDPEQGDFHLLADSPCIDAGCFIPGLTTDFEGDARPVDVVSEPRGDGSNYDIGADEFVISPTPIPTPTPVTRSQPDLWIRNAWENEYSGNDIYNNLGEGQNRTQTVDVGIAAKYYLRIENDGNISESFLITGNTGGSGWLVKYYDALIGGRDVTAQVTGSGWQVTQLPPGSWIEFRCEVRLDFSVPDNTEQ
ncbi:MAG: hypothetical protein N2246_11795, partial [Candidatus Sumerlaeia bacterium]|nr:hypothetical protein [Candidatus Sumerlaeia bacterium]